MRATAVTVVGSGAVGLFSALELAHRGARTVVVDPDGRALVRASSLRSAASLRQQFSLRENVDMSAFSAGVLARPWEHAHMAWEGAGRGAPPWWRPGAYAFLASTETGVEALRSNVSVQRGAGAHVELYATPAELRKRFPWLSTSDIKLASLGSPTQEGYIDAHLLCAHLRQRCVSLGVEFVTGKAETIDAENAVVLADGARIPSDKVVVAMGAWSGALAKAIGVDIPVVARRRVVYVWRCPAFASVTPDHQQDHARNALVIDPTGVYFRREAFPDLFLGGLSPPASEDRDYDPDAEAETAFNASTEADAAFFDERVWPVLAARVPAFESLKLTGSWAGFYDMNTWDECLLLGSFPERPSVVFSTGSSGHGLQHAPAQGRAVAELVLDGGFSSLDLSRLAVTRVREGVKVLERNIV